MMVSDPDILYLHGFRSSPDSEKAQTLHRWLREQGYSGSVWIPQLPHEPEAAMQQIVACIEATQKQGHQLGLIGSSLGGFFAAVAAEQFGLRAVLINPAARPYELLTDYTGTHTNMYTGEQFEVTQAHLQALARMDRPLRRPDNLFVLVEKGDETLDYRQAVSRYQGACLQVREGGDHSFTAFAECLPAIVDFLRTGDCVAGHSPC